MAIIIDQTRRVLVQGITGREGRARTRLMREYGTQVVAGCTPGKGGQEVEGIAVFNSVAEAVVVLLVLFQFVTILLTGHANQNALRLGYNLSTYVYQVLQFQTFNTESRPFPFSDWPDGAREDADDSWAASDEAVDDAPGSADPDIEPRQ